MNKRDIGNLIYYERTKRGIGLPRLTHGVCSASVIQRMEGGERLPDFLVLERLVERLGKSLNKIEFLHNEAAYDIYYLRESIELYVEECKYEEAADALVYYENLLKGREPMHWQYICKMRAVLAREQEDDHGKAALLLKEAMEQTLPGFDLNRLDHYLLGESELLLLLMWIQEKIDVDIAHITVDGSRLLHYIKETCQDEEVLANVYSKAVWVLGNMELKRQNPKEALWYTLKGEKMLAENGLLLHIPQFLERILMLTEGVDDNAYVQWKKQRDALKWVYEEYNEPYETTRLALWSSYRQQEVYFVCELVSQERKIRKHSQEKLADVLDIDQKTVSRLEGGKYKPKQGTFQKIKEYLELDRDVCSTRLVVNDFALLEMEREIAKQNHYKNYEEAEWLFQQLKSRLSMEWNENRQYVTYMEACFARKRGEISGEEAVRRCVEALRITRKNMGLEQIDEVVLSRMEAMIVNYIAVNYYEMGRREEAITILEKVKLGYENSKVDLKYHYVAMSLIYVNLSDYYEVSDRFEEAILACETGARFELRCKRGNVLGYFVEQRAYTTERMTNGRLSGKLSYRKAYQLCNLMREENAMRSLKNAYETLYKEAID